LIENRILRKILGPKREWVSEDWRKLHEGVRKLHEGVRKING